MYFKKSFLKSLFEQLQHIDEDGNNNLRKLKLSQLRHLVGVSILIRIHSIASKKVDLSPRTGKHRSEFKDAVGQVVKLNEQGLYTQNFNNEFAEARDYKTGNNFLTTMVRWNGPYPGQNSSRDGAVLDISEKSGKKYATFHKDMLKSLHEDYNIKTIKIPFALWLLRFENFEIADSGELDVNEVSRKINSSLKKILDDTLYNEFKCTASDLRVFIAQLGLTNYDQVFFDKKENLSFLVDEFGTEAEDKSSSNRVAVRKKQDSASSLEPTMIIFAGPPGTGKSRCAKILANLICNFEELPENLFELQSYDYPQTNNPNCFSVQFHPSYSYEDFVEGLRPTTIRQSGKSDIVYSVCPGSFKASVEIAMANYDSSYKVEIPVGFENGTSWQIFENPTIGLYRLLEREGQFFFKGTPVLDTPIPNGDSYSINEEEKPEGANGIYPLSWGPNNPHGEDVVLTIDEFNRGNPAIIFGEALSLIEATKRIGQTEEMSIALTYSGSRMSIPPNFHIIGTMNTADRTLSTIDLALRRRFKFIYLKPDFSLLEKVKNELESELHPLVDRIVEHFRAINKSLTAAGVNVDNHIGHSYAFMLLNQVKQSINQNGGDDWLNTLKESLERLWHQELHSVVRSIIGPAKTDRFSKALIQNLTSDNWFESTGINPDFIESKIKKFLEDPSGSENWIRDAS